MYLEEVHNMAFIRPYSCLLVLNLAALALSVNSTIVTRINRLLSDQGVSIFGPTLLHDLKLDVNNLKETKLENDMYYINYAYSSYCSESLINWTCHFCKILGPNVQLVSVITNNTFGTKAFIAIDPNREEIVLAFRGSVNIANFALDFTPVPVMGS